MTISGSRLIVKYKKVGQMPARLFYLVGKEPILRSFALRGGDARGCRGARHNDVRRWTQNTLLKNSGYRLVEIIALLVCHSWDCAFCG